MKLNSLHIYPVKSLGGITIDSSFAQEEGLQYDRRYMLVDDDGKFITQRENHKLTHIGLEYNQQHFKMFDKKNPENDCILEHDPDYRRSKVKVWKHVFEAELNHGPVSEWISEIIDQKCKLVKQDNVSNRIKTFSKSPYKTRLSFADGYPVLLTSTASLSDLNSRLENPVPMTRFRPNLVVGNMEAFQEDQLVDFQIGSAKFRVTKKCGRCIVTTTDQDTGIRTNEPLETLSKYRKEGRVINFGVYAIILEEGKLEKGNSLIKC